MVIEKEKLLSVNSLSFDRMLHRNISYTPMTNLSHFNVRRTHRKPRRTSQLLFEDCVLFVGYSFILNCNKFFTPALN